MSNSQKQKSQASSSKSQNIAPQKYQLNTVQTYTLPPHKLAQYKSYGVNFNGKIKFKIVNTAHNFQFTINPATLLVTYSNPYVTANDLTNFHTLVNQLFVLNNNFFTAFLSLLQLHTYIANLKKGKAKLPIYSKNYSVKFVVGKNGLNINHKNKTVTISHVKNASNWQISQKIVALYHQLTANNIVPLVNQTLINNKYYINKSNVSTIGTSTSSLICRVNSSSVSISPIAAAYTPTSANNMVSYILGVNKNNVNLNAFNNAAYSQNFQSLNNLLHYKQSIGVSAFPSSNFANLNF